MFWSAIPDHFGKGGQRDCQPVGQGSGIQNGGGLLKVSCVREARVGKFDVVGSEIGLERVKKSDEEILPDPLQRIQTREPLEHADIP